MTAGSSYIPMEEMEAALSTDLVSLSLWASGHRCVTYPAQNLVLLLSERMYPRLRWNVPVHPGVWTALSFGLCIYFLETSAGDAMDGDHSRDPCPYVHLSDFGAGFAMGAIGGGIWHGIKGARSSPKGNRLIGSLSAIKARAPVVGGNLAIFGGLLSTFEYVRSEGVQTKGGSVEFCGPRAMMGSAVSCAILMGGVPGYAPLVSPLSAVSGPMLTGSVGVGVVMSRALAQPIPPTQIPTSPPLSLAA
ncbi:uncharacterized protein MKK02DRAFT_30643 [Dioszegia hungarica]|uniref:Uncharacterized protein n=1 Tax=Dioszegia hungarica TaxID=4972 RepID=A0AA38H1B5_9TREE|nr:uncharacterized protein MKK02DRAFT_30643 [Dioszegia hungarica]KAI9632095.1 hypothetical protein MKK02DRAFT_30643 [Dioszegia hungarica]